MSKRAKARTPSRVRNKILGSLPLHHDSCASPGHRIARLCTNIQFLAGDFRNTRAFVKHHGRHDMDKDSWSSKGATARPPGRVQNEIPGGEQLHYGCCASSGHGMDVLCIKIAFLAVAFRNTRPFVKHHGRHDMGRDSWSSKGATALPSGKTQK